ncbi:hypothetical protein AWB94_08850 [Mycolicibacterium canariasense]|nr:hypothetical protein AWB94_08850 [Mycolicibacterium canariasense]
MGKTYLVHEVQPADTTDAALLISAHTGLSQPAAQRIAEDRSTLVAVTPDGEVCGVLGAGQPTATTLRVLREQRGQAFDPSIVPWWKIHALAVAEKHRRAGIARSLLAETVRRLPRRHVGLYGNVENHRRESINWYRRQGFYIGPFSGLTPTERAGGAGGIRVQPIDGETIFRGYRSTLREHLANREHPNWELRTARAEFTRWRTAISQTQPPAADLGYRLYARIIATQIDPSTCLHAAFGPRPLMVIGWDPDHTRACWECAERQALRVERFDSATLCDACGQHQPDVHVSWASDEDQQLIVYAGLCPPCRRGDREPSPHRPRSHGSK